MKGRRRERPQLKTWVWESYKGLSTRDVTSRTCSCLVTSPTLQPYHTSVLRAQGPPTRSLHLSPPTPPSRPHPNVTSSDSPSSTDLERPFLLIAVAQSPHQRAQWPDSTLSLRHGSPCFRLSLPDTGHKSQPLTLTGVFKTDGLLQK